MSYLEDLKNKALSDVAGYDPEKYRDEIGQAAKEHSTVYSDYSGLYADDDDPQYGSPAPEKSKTKLILIISAVVLLLAGGGYFMYKKGVFKNIKTKKTK